MAWTTSLFCGPTSYHVYPASQQFSKPIDIFARVVNGMNAVLTALGNTMILFALRKSHSLQSPSKALLFGLALTDLVVGLVVLPLFTAYCLAIFLETPTYFCAIAVTYGRISTFNGSVALATIATIAIDRYLAFRLRLRYRELVTLDRVICVLVVE